MEKLKSKKGNLKRMFHTSGTKHGSYSVGMTVLVVSSHYRIESGRRSDSREAIQKY